MPAVRPLAPFAAAALLLGALYGAVGCRGGTPSGSPAADDLLADASYVGDEACGACHESTYADFHRTGMGRAVSRFDPATASEHFDESGRSPVVCHDLTGYCYQAFVRGDTLYQREFRRDDTDWEQVYAVSHVVGSGNATRSYFMEVVTPGDTTGGYLTEMPLTWYVERAVWDMSPGYVQGNPRFDRPISLECMACHNGTPGHTPGTQNFYTDVPLGITCERCHGPGSVHVEARSSSDAGEGEGDPTIVNPARLAADLQLAVCQQCHLSGTTVFRDGHDPATYRPGQPLTSNRRVFVAEEQIDDPAAFGISSHAERLMRSACFIASQASARPMTCTTCHDPHRPNAELGADHFNAACRSCHGADAHQAVCTRPEVGAAATGAPAAVRMQAGTGDCVGCHLRRGGTSDIPHVSFTDHWIRRNPPAPAPTDPNARAARATPFALVDVTAREAEEAGRSDEAAESEADEKLLRGLATFHFYDTEHRIPAYLPQVVRLLREARAGGADHPEAALTLGRALLEMDSLAGAERALAEAVSRRPDDAFAAYWLGVARLERGNARGADEALARAIALQPRLVEAYTKRAQALSALGRTDEAIAALTEAVRRNPVSYPGAWNDLGLMELQRGRVTEARRALERAVRLDPRLAEAQSNLGAALLTAGDNAEAVRRLERALTIRPDVPAVLGNLGVAYIRLGRTADARRIFGRMVQLDPRDQQAAAYLRQLGG
ncbi:MAG TPA: tetratricopeptide repeat protein [Rhodothermales bacterium]|nr:tetratricopeptide repeat protein [Rhodothermales bacterium]